MKRNLTIITGAALVFIAIAEWVLAFAGPFVFSEKVTLLVLPFYTVRLSGPEKAAMEGFLKSDFPGDGDYVIVDEVTVEKRLKGSGLSVRDFITGRSREKGGEVASRVQAARYAMGYALKTGQGYDLMVTVLDTRTREEVYSYKQTFTGFADLLASGRAVARDLDTRKKGFSLTGLTYLPLLAICIRYGAGLVFLAILPRRPRPGKSKRPGMLLFFLFRMPEILFCLVLIFSLFAYIFSLNAGMDYVQRFMASGGNLSLAPDSGKELLNVIVRFLPLLLVSGFAYVSFRRKYRYAAFRYLGGDGKFKVWALPFTLLSAFMTVLAFPSAFFPNGFGLLALVCLVPLIPVILANRYRPAVFYGTVWGVTGFLVINYWLGTFSLVSLQFVLIIYLAFFLAFMAVVCYALKKLPSLSPLILPVLWVAFDYLRSTGFLGYPWGMLGTSLYGFQELIQIASLTGVWGVTFVAVSVNALLAKALLAFQAENIKKAVLNGGACIALVASCFLFGAVRIAIHDGDTAAREADRKIRVALVQENMDPRKHANTEVFAALIRLTDTALPGKPDIVVWSEGAFDWNIRAFTDFGPDTSSDSLVVRDFLSYQKKMEACLVTGVVDQDSAGGEKYYNSSVVLDSTGRIGGIYRKIHLVPFTECFPYREELPWLYDLLKEFDVFFWTAGSERTVFDCAGVRFFTPICFEDSFPAEVRESALKGTDMIVNLSNDYWSQTPVEAMQHAANALFRAVESNRPLLRATASGLTCTIDSLGRIKASLPCYEAGVLLADVAVPNSPATLYLLWGDYFPVVCMVVLAVVLLISIFRNLASRLGRQNGGKERTTTESAE